MKNYILLTDKSWHDDLFTDLLTRKEEKWFRIKSRDDFNINVITELKPVLIFIPHWSYLIPEEIFNKFTCIVFHMTDLPFGRGGSPLQNLIIRGYKETMISALKVDQGIDTGPIYIKEPLTLDGKAQEIFERSVPIIKNMIFKIIENKMTPIPQYGQPVIFKRRKPSDGRMNDLIDLNTVYDYIRMLDAKGYPPAFIETEHLFVEFSCANFIKDTEIQANVRIIKK